MAQSNSNDNARLLMAGCVTDLVAWLSNLPDPIIIGGNYDQHKLVQAVGEWAVHRKFDLVGGDVFNWRSACDQGFFLRSKQ